MMDPLAFWNVHAFRLMLLGTATIGGIASALGSFAYLRRQSMIGDVASHAALLGVVGAFVVGAGVLGVDGRTMALLVVGAWLTAVAAALLVNAIERTSVLHQDAAMAVVIALFFGGGLALLRLVQNSRLPGKGGLQEYLFGNAASITTGDLLSVLAFGGIALAIPLATWNAFTITAFDPQSAILHGFRARTVDLLMFGALTLAIVIGLKAVGLILMVAFAVTPAAAARQWVHSVGALVALSGTIGAGCAALGCYLSVGMGRVPTGPVVVLLLGSVLVFSLVAAPHRSVLRRALHRRRRRHELARRVAQEA
ncbi:manganese/zinc/iron transport system permease protein [Austwickia chelonae]|uniref:Putative ABC transporter permease protein n=1 Tax=Austwickia chelonae NBRC 105200 TaxID=1184607 RepID=K6WAY5_9MICO|nr:metal ABC transporter permease [Austwickia chelonae]GAB78982.1 putative ABC transporter permease protein [Austwickia chelonae NBRC 105200]SEV87777.1 manganese/zinc/iron transport system permease protein [Austwickia chelonae]